MALTINTNVASLTAQRNLTDSQSSLSTSLERLSSGLRINSARDDAAGLAISERFNAQIRGLNQGVRNANDGISLLQTAEGALGEVTSNLQRIRELAVQSANATNSASDRTTLQAEVSQLIAEIDRVSSQTKFNNINLLDGSFSSQAFQVGANANETVTISSIVNASSTQIGAVELSSGGSVVGSTGAILAANTGAGSANLSGLGAETDLTVTTADGGTSGAISYAASASMAAVASAINTAASSLGVTATASNEFYLYGSSQVGALTFGLEYGSGASLTSQTVAATITDTGDLSPLAAAINSYTSSTGVTATVATMDTGVTALKLTTSDGRNVAIKNFENTTNASATIAVSRDATVGSDVTLTDAAADSTVVTGSLTLSSSKGQITLANAGTDLFSSASAQSTLSSVNSLDVSTVTGATSALTAIDSALDQINSGRGDLGALQNRFESVVASSQISAENLSASKSRIVDADFAAETAQLTKSQILQQSGIAMLAQANSIPQNVLALLQ